MPWDAIKNIIGNPTILVAKNPANLWPMGKTTLQPEVFETIRNIIINGPDHSNLGHSWRKGIFGSVDDILR